MKTSDLFDDYYYAHDCGRPYQRDEGWLNFFDQIAKRIIEQSEPKTVLDAGCAWGFLVEAFRKRGVEAYGVDISEYAIQNTSPDIKPYCWIGSITEPFPEKYDLITCIEILEHMPRREAEKAIENLCNHTNEIVFSSTPFDYKETTHVNVHDPEYWAEQFARYGFYRDLEADLSWITSWAVRFVKEKQTSIRLVREYERKFWQLRKENVDLRQLSIEMQDRLKKQEGQVQSLGVQVAEKEQVVAALTTQMAGITTSKAWKAALLFRRMRVLLIPPDSRRARALGRFMNFLFFPFKRTRKDRELEDLALVRASGLFDEPWYLTNNPDVAQAKVDPLLHYLLNGGFEGRDPGSNFKSAWYLNAYEDVKKSGVNPLVHYLKYGRKEGRATQPYQIGLQELHNSHERNGLSDYDRWITLNEPSPADLNGEREKSNNFDYRPLVSIAMPVWNTPANYLDQAIRSVLDQTYEKWEFCIVDGNSNDETKNILSSWAKKDPRIKIKFLDENKGIAMNSNEALSLAQGEFVGFLDHDDILAPFALFEVVRLLQINKDIDVIYSDEDKTDEEGLRAGAFFKPDFSPDYLRGVNYMPHFLIVRKSLGDQINWLREGYDGAQDYDLILRLIEKARGVAHIPKILYHWRVWTASTAGGVQSKPYANESGKKALRGHLERIGLPAHVKDGYAPTIYRAHYHITSTPLISIIIPNHNHATNLERCLDSILQKTTYPNIEIVIIENGSKEQETFKLYEQYKSNPKLQIMKWEEPFNSSRVNNWATKQANGDVFLFLNNDTKVVNEDWLEQMLQFAIRPDVGAVGAKLYYPDGTIEHGGIIIGIDGLAGYSYRDFPQNDPGYFFQLVLPHNVSAVSATCLMVRRRIFQEANGFDENYVLALGDIDLCLRILKNGYLNVWTPYAELTHYTSKTSKPGVSSKTPKNIQKEIAYFQQTWEKFLKSGDPYYNPNFSLDD
jgi:glycosyltransferase involved in cell wall biosynthesis/SAM-dependent methyltransferase